MPAEDDPLSFLSGGPSPASSSGYSKPQPPLPTKKKKTDPTLYIVGGVIALIVVVGIVLLASGGGGFSSVPTENVGEKPLKIGLTVTACKSRWYGFARQMASMPMSMESRFTE